MLTDKKVLSKLGQIERYYSELRFETVLEVPMEYGETREHFRSEPAEGVTWSPAQPPMQWGGSWITAWFRGEATLPDACSGRKVLVRAKTGGETLFFVDGCERGVFDANHPVVMMTASGEPGRTHHLSLEAYSDHSRPCCGPFEGYCPIPDKSLRFEGVEIVLEREDVTAFVFDLKVLRQVMDVLDEHSLRRNAIARALAEVYRLVDTLPDETGEESWRPKLAPAREVMKPLLAMRNAPTTPWFGLIGHSHMDTAWLWPLAETWRKCARTYSSVLNLMEQYPEMTFLQAAPCHAEMMRLHYPEVYRGIEQAVAAGRWEPNGGMYVECDCNIPSGESFVRQFLVGRQATREMFGYTSDTLWMPDTFGYSAALPQILRGCGIEFFCTTKISWNDTTRFPLDTFVWRGIDDSPVIVHFNAIHAWPDPKTLKGLWDYIQHKDVQDRRLLAYGFGDGGGGPMAEMIEVARRVGDLEGCPRTRHTAVSEFMCGIRDELTGLPEWVGELYLELHRGTLTSVAAIKRGNRLCEIAMREAEFLCALAALRGADYPHARLLELWKTLLINQFHDILPGSSIAEVNDEAVETFGAIFDGAQQTAAAALRQLAGPPAGEPGAALVFNSLSWERAGEMPLDGVPEGMCPAGEAVRAQWVEGPDGRRTLASDGLRIPALGAATVPLRKGEPGGESPFSVDGDLVTTPHAEARFDAAGRIVSLLDKATGREVVKPGGALNAILIGEDVPEANDNWDIDWDQHLKMHAEDAPAEREVVADGPLQLRIRIRRALGTGSSLVQDVVFHAGTPRVDFESVLQWSEKHTLLKVSFDLNVLCEQARHEIQYGHVLRPTHSNRPHERAQFEVCNHKWTDLAEAGFGVALLNDCKYGVSARGSTLGLTLVKSGTHPDARGDEGTHVFAYALLPHAGAFCVESVVRPAYEFNVRPTVHPCGADAVAAGSLLTVDAPNVIVEAVKWAEAGDGLVVRLYEASKTATRATLALAAPVREVVETNLLEDEVRALPLRDGEVTLELHPFEIKTLLCRF